MPHAAPQPRSADRPTQAGISAAPTQAAGNNSTRIATTAFVEARASVTDGGTA